MAPVNESLPTADRWRMLLVLRTMAPAALRVGLAVDAAACDTDDVVTMVRGGWIEAVRGGELVVADVVAKWRDDDSIMLRLTTAGRAWLQNSPHNQIMFTIYASAGKHRRGMWLYDVAQQADASLDWFTRLARRGYIRLMNEAGETIDGSAFPAGAIRRDQKHRVALTAVGAGIVST